MFRLDRTEYRAPPTLFSADPTVMRRARLSRNKHDAGEVAQDFVQYSLDDYARRRRGAQRWRDLQPAYAFALVTHAADWPRGSADTGVELAEHWEQSRGESRLRWEQVRDVIEDAWLALDRMPTAAVHVR
ncbi:MAG: hypothetical protein ACREP4_06825 [Stenotrophomonas sp.]|uniref:hypothetical protein n=1 Tax=Stenotrophomonas sp. TaxID=69392 RepID=UPI003D6C8E6C